MAVRAIEEVYRRDHERLWRSLFAYAGDDAIASDSLSEAFAQALRRGDAIRDPAAWIWRSAFKIAGGLLQSRRADEAADVYTLTGRAEVDEALIEFLDLLDGLSDQQRAIVVLRYAANLAPREIAEVLGSTPGSVRVQLHTAHDRLRPLVEIHR